MNLIIFIYILFNSIVLGSDIISFNYNQINFHSITADNLDQGFVETGNLSPYQSLEINVSPNSTSEWELFISANDIKSRSIGEFKVLNDILWKHSYEKNNDYHSLSMEKILIAKGVGREKIIIDLKILVDWEDNPGEYDFTIYFNFEQNIKMKSKRKIMKQIRFGNQ